MKMTMDKKSNVVVMILALMVILPLATTLGQDAAAEGAAPAGGSRTLFDYIKGGGIWMVPLFALSIAMVSFIVRNVMILKRDKLLRLDIIPQLSQTVATGDIGTAIQFCDGNDCLMTRVVKGGLERITTDEIEMDSVKEGIDQAAGVQMATYMKSINWLSNIGSVAPMMGLLGTVVGMIGAFGAIASGGMGVNAEAMADNIGIALITTAAGLIIAIPSMLSYYYFKNNFGETVSILGTEVGAIMNALRTGVVTGHFHLVDHTHAHAEAAPEA